MALREAGPVRANQPDPETREGDAGGVGCPLRWAALLHDPALARAVGPRDPDAAVCAEGKQAAVRRKADRRCIRSGYPHVDAVVAVAVGAVAVDQDRALVSADHDAV